MAAPSTPLSAHAVINPLTGKRYSRAGLLQAYELRDLAWGLAKKLGTGMASETEQKAARDVTGLIRAWSEADDRVRVHRGKPLPGTLRPKEKKHVYREVRPLVEP
jgi:hypothetical protein